MEKEKRLYIVNNGIAVCIIILNLVVGITVKSFWIKVLPSLVSPIIYLLASKANKWTYILGGVNAAVYSIGYFIEGIYGLTVNALLVSCPVQIYTFFAWKKRSYKTATEFRTLKWWQRVLLGVGTIGGIGITYVVLINFNSSSNQLLDATVFTVGTTVTFLIAFAFMEAIIYNFLNTTTTLVLWIVSCVSGNLGNLPYLIVSSFSLYCTILAAIKWIQLYKEQKNKKQGEN